MSLLHFLGELRLNEASRTLRSILARPNGMQTILFDRRSEVVVESMSEVLCCAWPHKKKSRQNILLSINNRLRSNWNNNMKVISLVTIFAGIIAGVSSHTLLANNDIDTYLRRRGNKSSKSSDRPDDDARLAGCGKYTAGTAAAQAGVNIVHDLWQRNGENCRYASRQFRGDVERALLDEFPDNCRDTGAVSFSSSDLASVTPRLF